MDYRDISPEIANVAQNYGSHKLPPWILRLQELAQQMILWLQEFITSLFQHHSTAAANTSALSTIMQIGLYIAGLAALIVICVLLWRRVALKQEQTLSTRRGAAAIEKILDSSGYRREAEELAKAGDFKGACRAVYLCFLQNMHEQTVATFAPAKTNYEYRYLLLKHPALKEEFIQLADLVEQVWFGNKHATQAEYETSLSLLKTTDTEVKRISDEKKAKAAAEVGL